jgi:gas vesicle protein
MSDKSLETLKVVIEGDAQPLKKELKDLQKELNSVNKNMDVGKELRNSMNKSMETMKQFREQSKKINDSIMNAFKLPEGGKDSSDKKLDAIRKVSDEMKKNQDAWKGSIQQSGTSASDISGMTVGRMFKTETFSNQFANFSKMVKDACSNADFTGIGSMVEIKLKEELDNIKWKNIQDSCDHIAKSVGTFINGFLETNGLDKSIGKTIGKSINTGVGTVNTFLKTVKFTELGTFIANTANNAIKTTDFKQIGETVANGLSTGINTWGSFVTTFNLDELGTKLGDAIKKAFDHIPWNDVKQAFKDACTNNLSNLDINIGGVNVKPEKPEKSDIKDDIIDIFKDAVKSFISDKLAKSFGKLFGGDVAGSGAAGGGAAAAGEAAAGEAAAGVGEIAGGGAAATLGSIAGPLAACLALAIAFDFKMPDISDLKKKITEMKAKVHEFWELDVKLPVGISWIQRRRKLHRGGMTA